MLVIGTGSSASYLYEVKMGVYEYNQAALEELSRGNFSKAQELLFENAQKNPCHGTYNNLGYYLCTEGLECKNGKVRNADILGMKYLLKAKQLRRTSVNLSNIATAIHLRLGTESKKGANPDDIYSFQNAYVCLKEAVLLHPSDETEYNMLRFLYLMDQDVNAIVKPLEQLITKNLCQDSVNFYLSLLCKASCFEKCLTVLEECRYLLDEMDLLTYFCLCGEYEKGADLYDDIVCSTFYLGEEYSAMMLECLVRSDRKKQMASFLDFVKRQEAGLVYPSQKEWMGKIPNDQAELLQYTNTVISRYRYVPQYRTPCGYFGCKEHGTEEII